MSLDSKSSTRKGVGVQVPALVLTEVERILEIFSRRAFRATASRRRTKGPVLL